MRYDEVPRSALATSLAWSTWALCGRVRLSRIASCKVTEIRERPRPLAPNETRAMVLATRMRSNPRSRLGFLVQRLSVHDFRCARSARCYELGRAR